MNNSSYLFCNVPRKMRAEFCFFSTNLCCYNCVKNKECQEKNSKSKYKPCAENECEPEEICQYMI